VKLPLAAPVAASAAPKLPPSVPALDGLTLIAPGLTLGVPL
jgi:hypothetical protein